LICFLRLWRSKTNCCHIVRERKGSKSLRHNPQQAGLHPAVFEARLHTGRALGGLVHVAGNDRFRRFARIAMAARFRHAGAGGRSFSDRSDYSKAAKSTGRPIIAPQMIEIEIPNPLNI